MDIQYWDIGRLRLADNRTGELSAWDGGLLSDELEALKGEFDFRSLGFGDAEYRRLLDRLDPLSVAEDAWKPGGDVPGVSPGDAFRLGDHLVVCGKPDPSRMPERASCAFCETPEGDETPWGALVSMSDGAVYAAFPPERLGSAKDAFERAGGHWSDFVLWARGSSFTPVLYGWREGSPRRCGAATGTRATCGGRRAASRGTGCPWESRPGFSGTPACRATRCSTRRSPAARTSWPASSPGGGSSPSGSQPPARRR